LATVSTNVKRAIVRELFRKAEREGKPIRDILDAYQTARVGEPSTGRVIVSTSANGQSTTFANIGGITQDELLDLSEELITRYEAALTALEYDASEATDPANLSAIRTEILALLVESNEAYADFTEIRA
jgi:hypothetical protein